MSEAGPTQQALDALWRRHERGWRRLLPPHLVRELGLRARFDLSLVEPERVASLIPKGQVPDCEQCDDICCAGVENVVSLRLRDIAVLIDIGRTDLIARSKPRFSPQLLAARPNLQALSESELWRTLPVLRQVGERRICAALTPELRCGLYPNWPLSCERFPYTLNNSRASVHWGTRCPAHMTGPEYEARSEELLSGAILTFNERVRDAVLLTHARRALDRLGIGAFLAKRGEDPFEPAGPAARLPILP